MRRGQGGQAVVSSRPGGERDRDGGEGRKPSEAERRGVGVECPCPVRAGPLRHRGATRIELRTAEGPHGTRRRARVRGRRGPCSIPRLSFLWLGVLARGPLPSQWRRQRGASERNPAPGPGGVRESSYDGEEWGERRNVCGNVVG